MHATSTQRTQELHIIVSYEGSKDIMHFREIIFKKSLACNQITFLSSFKNELNHQSKLKTSYCNQKFFYTLFVYTRTWLPPL